MSIKKGKWERKNRPAPEINPEKTPSPAPAATVALAHEGIPINRGASEAMPISEEGKVEAQKVAGKLAAKGGVDSITSDGSRRTQETAGRISKADPKKTPVSVNEDLGAMRQGNLEGKPKHLVRDHLDNLIRHNPTHRIEGRGALSNKAGESFDDFRKRVLTGLRGEMHALAQNPNQTRVIVGHSSAGNLIKSWIEAGTPDNFGLKNFNLNKAGEKPGMVDRIFPGPDGHWRMEPANLDSPGPLQKGSIYHVRHAMTPQNEHDRSNMQADSLNDLKKQVLSSDWPRVYAEAKRLIKAGVPVQQIEAVVEGAMPKMGKVAKLPLHHAVAAYAASSPERKAEYEPIVHQRVTEAMQSLLPHAQAVLHDHLRTIGRPHRQA